MMLGRIGGKKDNNDLTFIPVTEAEFDGTYVTQIFIPKEETKTLEEPLLLQFNQADLSYDQTKYKELQRIEARFKGFCELISNYVLLNDLMGKQQHGISATSKDINIPSEILFNRDKDEISLTNAYEGITIDAVNSMRNTHILKVSSVFTKILAFAFDKFPNSALSFADQKKVMSNRTINQAILDKCLNELQENQYLKFFSYKKEGLKYDGHSCLIKKTGANTYSFFDPNQGEFVNLTSRQLANKMNEMMWKFGYQGMVLQHTSKVKQMLHKKVRQEVPHSNIQNEVSNDKSAVEGVPAPKTEPVDDDISENDFFQQLLKSKELSNPFYGKINNLSNVNWDILGEHEAFAMRAFVCSDINKLSMDHLHSAINYLQQKYGNNPEQAGIEKIINGLQQIVNYLEYRHIADDPNVSVSDKEHACSDFSSKLQDAILQHNTLFAMQGANLSGINLIFDESNNKETNDIPGNFTGANFTGATLSNARFYTADLNDANFNGANLSSIVFRSTKLVNATFTDASMVNSVIQSSVCGNARFDNARCYGIRFYQATFKGNSFKNADLRSCSISNCTFDTVSRASILQSDLRGVIIDKNSIKSFPADFDFLPEKWQDRNVLNDYLDKAIGFHASRGKITIVENIIRNLNQNLMPIESRIELLQHLKDHEWLDSHDERRSFKLFKSKHISDTDACKGMLQDEIDRLEKMLTATPGKRL